MLSGLSAPQQESLRAKANEHLSDGVYSALETGSFKQAQVQLLKNADLMDPKQFDRLQQGINSAQEHQIMMADKAQADASKRTLTDIIYRSTQPGGVSAAYVNSKRFQLEPAAYELSLKLASGKEAITDAPTYLALLNRQSHGEDVRDDTMHAAAQGLLDKQDAGKLLESSGKEMPEFYKRGHDYIATAGQVSQLEPDPAKTQTLANMQNDWFNDVKQHPEWAQDPAKAEADFRGIVSRYQLVKADQNLLTLPVPHYFQGTRIQPDIQASKQATVKALENQEIDENEFNKQAFLLQQWQHALEITQARKAAAAKAAAAEK